MYIDYDVSHTTPRYFDAKVHSFIYTRCHHGKIVDPRFLMNLNVPALLLFMNASESCHRLYLVVIKSAIDQIRRKYSVDMNAYVFRVLLIGTSACNDGINSALCCNKLLSYDWITRSDRDEIHCICKGFARVCCSRERPATFLAPIPAQRRTAFGTGYRGA